MLFFLLGVILYWIVWNNPYLYNYHRYKNTHFYFALILLWTLPVWCLREVIFPRSRYRITLSDCLFLLLVLIILVSRHGSGRYFNEIVLNLFLVIPLYPLTRLLIHRTTFKRVFALIASVFLVELAVLVYQYCIDYQGGNYLQLTGTLDNSGLCACCIVLLSPIVMYCIHSTSTNRVYSSVFLALCCGILCVLQSRAALLSFVVITGIAVTGPLVRKRYGGSRAAYLGVLIAVIVVLCLLPLLIGFKQDSAVGRLAIWEISLNHLFDIPMFGVGYGAFPKVYQGWQTAYFSGANYDPQYIPIVDLPNNVFNEPLQLFIELGIVGSIGAALYAMVLMTSSITIDRRAGVILKLSMLSVFLFSLFSYPLHSLPILVLAIVIVALLSGLSDYKYQFHITGGYVRWLLITCIPVALFFSIRILDKNSAIQEWNTAKAIADPNLAIGHYVKAHPLLQDNGMFLFDYGVFLYKRKEYRNSIAVLTQSNLLRADIDVVLYLGQNYEALADYTTAEQYYFNAMYSIPNRFRPKYLLLKLFITRHDTENAKAMAEDIVTARVKVHSPEVYDIRNFAKEYLASGDGQY